VDFELPGEGDRRRREVRSWLAEHVRPTGRQLAEAGLVAPHWPRPYGLDADPIHQLIIDDELRAAGVRRPANPIGIGWAGPTILHGGTRDQHERYLLPLLAGEEIWCQLFSEPEAGSDLANLATRAEPDGDSWIVNGQKIWTTLGHRATFGILIARTSPRASKHRGISYFICPMATPGISVQPIVDMTGLHAFNQIFFDDVRIPGANLVGEVGQGWELAKVTLSNERVSLSSGGVLWGDGPLTSDLFELIRARGGVGNPLLRQRLAQLYIEGEVLRLIRLRTITAAVHGKPPGPEASVRKAMADDHGQRVMAVAKDLAGAHGMLTRSGPLGGDDGGWHFGYLYSRALTIGGGTSEVQRNIIAERVLGLPHDLTVG
jgi:alkylation response protein AidB-like acyl-CoA dehydrogenase